MLLVKSTGLGHMFEQGSVPERVLTTSPFLGAAALKAEGVPRFSLASCCVKLSSAERDHSESVRPQVDDKGDAFQYTVLATRDVLKTAEAIKQAGAPIVQDVSYMPGTEVTWVVTQDPSGWKFAFISESDYFKDIKRRQQVE